MIYLDNAATTPLAPEVQEVMSETARLHFGNPSSIHKYGRESRVIIEEARSLIASFLNADTSEIIFTSGGTEAINMVIRGCVNDLEIKNVITSPLEHPAVLNTLQFLRSGSDLRVFNVDLLEKGKIDLNSLADLLDKYPGSLVILMHANNEIGNLTDIGKVTKLCRKHDSLYLADTVQTLGKYEFDFRRIPLDFACCSAHKIHGPKGVGFLYMKGGINFSPLIVGGGQERNMRAGTENISGIAAMAKAFEIAYDKLEENSKHIKELKSLMVSLLKENIDDISFNGESEEEGLYTVLSASFPKNDWTEMMLFNLDIAGIAASGGSACHSGDESVSSVLKSIGSDSDRITVRFSFSRYNTINEIETCVKKISKIMKV